MTEMHFESPILLRRSSLLDKSIAGRILPFFNSSFTHVPLLKVIPSHNLIRDKAT